MESLPAESERAFFAALEYASDVLMGTSKLTQALHALTKALDEEAIPYAIIGALALGEHGYRRTTEDIDVLLTPEGLRAFKAARLGRGWVERFEGSKGLRDTRHDVPIDVVLAGDFPGDGKPKPVRFPDPAEVAVRGQHVALMPLPKLLELKLASGMTAPHRLRDLADVLELIRVRSLPRELADDLDPFVRAKYLELWEAAEGARDDER